MTHALRDSSPDPLGYDIYAQTLWARVQAALNKDANGKDVNGRPLGDDPLVIGLFGEWGAGKSYLLDLIKNLADAKAKERIETRKTDAGFGLTVPVLFQPWKYEHEPHLLVPLLLHILAALEQHLALAQTTYEKTNQTIDQVGDAVVQALPSVVKAVGGLVKSIKTAVAGADPTIAAGLLIAETLAALAKSNAQSTKRQSAAKQLSHSDDGRFYYEVHDILKHITRPAQYPSVRPGINIHGSPRINFVIFIDDLDRCLKKRCNRWS